MQNGWVRGNMRKLDAAKSTLLEPVLSLREADVSPMPRHASRRSRSPSTTRGTCTAPARASASGSPRPTATSRSGLSARRSPPDRRRSRSATAEDAVAPRPPGGAGRERADRASTLPGPARRAVPRLPALRERQTVGARPGVLRLARPGAHLRLRQAAEADLVAVVIAVDRLADAVRVRLALGRLAVRVRRSRATSASRSSTITVTSAAAGARGDPPRCTPTDRRPGSRRSRSSFGKNEGSPRSRSYHARAAVRSRTRSPANSATVMGAH